MKTKSFTVRVLTKDLETTKCIRAGGVKLFRSVYQPGYKYEVTYHEDNNVSSVSTKHVVVSGSLVDQSGVVKNMLPGWVSSLENVSVPAGTYIREAPDGAEFWCIHPQDIKDGDVDHVVIHDLAVGDTLQIATGHCFVAAEGDCAIGDRLLAQEKPYFVKSETKTITAVTRCFIFVWPDSPQ